MTVIIDGSNGITFPNSTTQISAGSVLQVVSTNSTVGLGTSSTSYVTTGLSASITPKFSSSKILILITGQTYSSASVNSTYLGIYRNSTLIFENAGSYSGAGGVSGFSSINCLDSPATTSSTTYTLYTKNAGGAVSYFNSGALSVNITLMEIAA